MPMSKINLLIQGWRGTSHSYALVNQFQMLELLKRPEFALFHEDMPFLSKSWSEQNDAGGFDKDRARTIAAVPPPLVPVDAVYRIGVPCSLQPRPGAKTFCYLTCEFRTVDPNYFPGVSNFTDLPDTVDLVTPSHWSKAGLVRSGFAAERIHVIPNGIDPSIFRPQPAAERAAIRQSQGVAPDRFIFLSIGGMFHNKGIDVLLKAFAQVHRRYPHTGLVLKDQSSIYPIRVGDIVKDIINRHGLDPSVRSGLSLVSGNLNFEQMRQLYTFCNAYVAPYRGEGFCIPPLEAAACGLPIIVTAGGATDDYADASLAFKIQTRDKGHGNELDPDPESLIDCMERLIEGRAPEINPDRAVAYIGENFTWARAVDRLVPLLTA